MLEVPEYDLTQPDSLVVLPEDDVISAGEAKWFRRQLERVAGKNRFGRANLEMRWGPTYEDPMSVDRQIKYLDFTHGTVQLGERRWFLEVWRSPEFLKRSGRYKIINDSDTVQEFYFCKACDAEITCDASALAVLGSVPSCPKCGSNRVRTEMDREMGKGQLLQEFPSEGCYDYWLRLERANLTYHPPDGEALKAVTEIWEFEKLPQNQRDELAQADAQLERRQMIGEQRRQMGGGIYTGIASPTLPPMPGETEQGYIARMARAQMQLRQG